MNIDENLVVAVGGGFFIGVLIRYALKKVLKVLAIVVGLFFAGLAYLQYQQIVNINWNKLQTASQDAVTTVFAITQISNHIGDSIANIKSWDTTNWRHVPRIYNRVLKGVVLVTMIFKRLIDIGAKILDILEDSYVPEYTQLDSLCESCNQNENTYYLTARNNKEVIKPTVERYGNFFDEIIGFIDGTYGSKAGIFERIKNTRSS